MFRRVKRYIFNISHPVQAEGWQLHRVTHTTAEDEKERLYEITPDRLENLLKKTLQNHCTFCSVDDITSLLIPQQPNNQNTDFQKRAFPHSRKLICLTLDDGYEDNYTYALPLFRKYNVPFCIYITKDYIEHGHKNYRFLNIDQLLKLSADPLCTLGCHTCSHPRLNSLSIEEQQTEIAECKLWLEQTLGKPVKHLAYPYGDFSADTIHLVQALGFKTAVAAWGGGLRKGVAYSPFAIPRLLVTQNDIK